MMALQMPISTDAALPDRTGLVLAYGIHTQRMAECVVQARNEFVHGVVRQSTFWATLTSTVWGPEDAAAEEPTQTPTLPKLTADDIANTRSLMHFAAQHAQRRQPKTDK